MSRVAETPDHDPRGGIPHGFRLPYVKGLYVRGEIDEETLEDYIDRVLSPDKSLPPDVSKEYTRERLSEPEVGYF